MKKEGFRFHLRTSENNEYHIFEGYKLPDSCHITKEDSLCGQVNTSKTKESTYSCLTKPEFKQAFEKLGTAMCGQCMSVIFKTPSD